MTFTGARVYSAGEAAREQPEHRERAQARRPPRYITPEGFQRSSPRSTQRIWTVLRPRIVAEVEAAAALGDRSENAEYVYGKKKLRELDRRLRLLSERMDSLTVVDPKPHPSGRAYFGAWVTVEHEDGAERDLPAGRARRVRRRGGPASAWTPRSGARCSASRRATPRSSTGRWARRS